MARRAAAVRAVILAQPKVASAWAMQPSYLLAAITPHFWANRKLRQLMVGHCHGMYRDNPIGPTKSTGALSRFAIEGN